MTRAPSPSRPLDGRRVVVTRAEDQADPLSVALRALGAEPLLVPSVRTAASDPAAVAEAARGLAGARWLVFTSPSGVRYGWPAVTAAWPAGRPDGLGVAAVGPGTAVALRALGVRVDFVPATATGDALASGLPVGPADRVVLFRSDIARRAVAETIRARGADVVDVVAYRTLASADPATAGRALAAVPDAVLFTSPSTVRGFLDGVDRPAQLHGVLLVPIGPVTAAAIEAAGFAPAPVPGPYTVDGLLAALVDLLA